MSRLALSVAAAACLAVTALAPVAMAGNQPSAAMVAVRDSLIWSAGYSLRATVFGKEGAVQTDDRRPKTVDRKPKTVDVLLRPICR